jgi:hypothetical protein
LKNKRRECTANELLILYNQVDGICPLCSKKLSYEKEGKTFKLFENAHIYPLNPTPEEIILLNGLPVLFKNDVNDLDNLIALCPNCHSVYDKPTTVDSYLKLYNIKKEILKKGAIINLYSDYTIETEIIEIISSMLNGLDDSVEHIDYSLFKIDEKISAENKILIKKVKNDVADYYLFIKNIFAEMDRSNSGIFNTIAGQIKSFYSRINQITDDQEKIYNYIAEWLYNKLKVGSIEGCRIVVSFFIQNCEVFSSVAK